MSNQKSFKVGYYNTDYSKTGVFEETKELPRVEFVYKPMTMGQSAAFTSAIIKNKDLLETIEESLRMLVKHLVSWDLLTPDGSLVPIQLDEVKKVAPKIIDYITDCIKGDNDKIIELAKDSEELKKAYEDEAKNL
jgi:hypothetical protein